MMQAVNYLLTRSAKLGLDLVSETDNAGRNCLFYCVSGSDVDMFDLLVSRGCTVRPSMSGQTPLMQVQYLPHSL